MELLPLSFLAGILTVLAPCILPLLPVIIGGSLTDRNPWRPVIITLSLAGSVVLFTLLLKASTIFIDIPQAFWAYFSAGIILLFAFSLLFPLTWARLVHRLGLGRWEHSAQKALHSNSKEGSLWGMVATGGALGPVFSSCSPTYFFVLGTVLPESWALGLVHLVAYALGLSLVMFVVAFAGQRALGHLEGLSNPYGWFKRSLGVLFLLVGLAIATGYDKKLEIAILDAGFFDVSQVEQRLLDAQLDTMNDEQEAEIPESPQDSGRGETPEVPLSGEAEPKEERRGEEAQVNPVPPPPSEPAETVAEEVGLESLRQVLEDKLTQEGIQTVRYVDEEGLSQTVYLPLRQAPGDLEGTGAWFNSEPIESLQDLEGKVVAVKFWTYSCINCIRTLDETQALWEKYQDDDFVLLAVHTPEFAFERDPEAVKREIAKYGLTFPVVQDNDYQTWRSFNNRYWPAFYLLDRTGQVRYTHFGEGRYQEKDQAVGALLSLK